MTKQTLLLTGFEPFDKWDTNPSWEIAQALNGRTIGGVKVTARLLPVEWERSWPALQAAIDEAHSRWVLMLGLAGKRPHISIESVAHNVCDDKPDNTGKTH